MIYLIDIWGEIRFWSLVSKGQNIARISNHKFIKLKRKNVKAVNIDFQIVLTKAQDRDKRSIYHTDYNITNFKII